MSKYQHLVRCDNCHEICNFGTHRAKFYNSFASYVCGACGHNGFYDSAEKWISTAKLLNPLTWFSGYWQKAGNEDG